MAEKVDIEISKNEDHNKFAGSDLHKRLVKIHEGGSERPMDLAESHLFMRLALLVGLCSSAHHAEAQIFQQTNGASIEVTANERTLANTPEPYTCAQDWAEITILLVIDRDGIVQSSMLFTSSNYFPPKCTDEATANARALKFSHDPKARKKEWVFVTYRIPKKE